MNMHRLYATLRDEYGVVTFATEMGVCDYQDVFKGTSGNDGFHMSQCITYEEARKALKDITRKYGEEGYEFALTIEYGESGVAALTHDNNQDEIDENIDFVFDKLVKEEKEMIFGEIKEACNRLSLATDWDNDDLQEDLETIQEAIEKLKSPTSDEVCEALEKEIGKRVKYKEDSQAFIEFDSQQYILLPSDVGIVFGLTVHHKLYAKTLILIGRFYEEYEHEHY